MANLVPLLAAETDLVVMTDGRRAPSPLNVAQVPLAVAAGLPAVVWLQWSAARWLWSDEAVPGGIERVFGVRFSRWR